MLCFNILLSFIRNFLGPVIGGVLVQLVGFPSMANVRNIDVMYSLNITVSHYLNSYPLQICALIILIYVRTLQSRCSKYSLH